MTNKFETGRTIKWMKLKDLVEIQNGYQGRPDHGVYTDDLYRLIQGKDIDEHSNIRWENLESININRAPDNYFTEKGNVLLQARGVKHNPILVDADVNNAIAGHTFFILRLKSELILPEYLCIALSSKKIQEEIEVKSGGVIISFISKTNLESIEIPVPDKHTQKTIINLNELLDRKRDILNEIINKYNQLENSVLDEILFKGESNG